MAYNLILDLDIPETNDYFRIVNSIKSIEQARHPDIEKIKILYREAKRAYLNLNINNVNKIKSLKWNGNTYVQADQTEEKLGKEICDSFDKGQSYHQEVGIKNLIRLAQHYKILYNNSKVYKPFFDSCIELMQRIIEHPKIETVYKDSKISDELLNKITTVEEENLQLHTQLKKLQDDLDYLQTEVSDNLYSSDMIKLMGRIYSDNITDEKLVRILIISQSLKKASIKQIFYKTKIPPSDIKQVVKDHPEFFNVDDKGMISLKFEQLIQESESSQSKKEVLERMQKRANKIRSKIERFPLLIKSFKKLDNEPDKTEQKKEDHPPVRDLLQELKDEMDNKFDGKI